ncbi:hypothetical protein GIB67_005217 [Kingdonia uniflora]|uniref:Zinc finger PHD-type domain-containing protein n=1 Tax=Kingdonia uniflora TaxID=39325 RepID=A0A7J7NN45_9MAGN|nr:hypothetical protein GIB67_005217 [Kingdonia uniflora]
MTACSSCESDDKGSNAATRKPEFVELQGHLLHGVLHSNGFGHLLCVNGVEKDSELTGNEIMDFWDRICTGLQARKISVSDVSRKRNMDLRLVHGIAFGEPWFGRWGYKFGRGSFGVTQTMYQKAIEGIQSIPLSLLFQYFSYPAHEIQLIFDKYQTLSGNSLATLGHLFRFMQELKARLQPETSIAADNSRAVVETACRWSSKRIEMAIRVIVEALRKAEFRWMSRQEVRDAARSYIGDTGLLDFVLKSLGNHVVGNYIVRRSVNPVTKVLEYCLEDISNVYSSQGTFSLSDPTLKFRSQITKNQLTNDMLYLYKYIFKEPSRTLDTGLFSAIQIASRIVLDSKHLVKDYIRLSPKIESSGEENLKLLCTICLRDKDVIHDVTKTVTPPYNLIVVPPHVTFRELMTLVEKSFKETYWGLRSFVAETILDVLVNETDLVVELVETGSSLVISGRLEDKDIDIEGIYECKKESFVLECACGAKEDDGERMISCDICEVRQHNRCARVSTTEDVPHIFLCGRCEQDIALFPSLP